MPKCMDVPGSTEPQVMFACPGCGCNHAVRVPPRPHAWGFNGNYDAPTFTPSVLVQGGGIGGREDGSGRCHSFVRDGHIEFLSDCTHALAGKTVELENI